MYQLWKPQRTTFLALLGCHWQLCMGNMRIVVGTEYITSFCVAILGAGYEDAESLRPHRITGDTEALLD